jgi:hypothetical protein
MTKEDLNKLVTIEDLENFGIKLISEIKKISGNKNAEKEFYSPKEFSHITGMKYSTVVYRCKVGKLKARQDDPNCSWSIHKSEVERFIQEASI